MQIHHTAVVSLGAELGQGVVIGPFSVIHDGTRLGDRTVVESHCVLGRPIATMPNATLSIGKDSLIRSHSVFYTDTVIGDGLRTGHHVTVREGLKAGVGVQIGTLNDIQGNCKIGDHVRFHSNVHVGQLTEIESFVWVFPYVVFTNDPHPPSEAHLSGVYVEEFAAIATMSTILPGVRIGARSLVGAHSNVNRDVPSDMVVSGNPAIVRGPTSDIKLSDGSGSAYPWMRHFHRGYPSEVVDDWLVRYPLDDR